MKSKTSLVTFGLILEVTLSGCSNLRPEFQNSPTAVELNRLTPGPYTGPVQGDLPDYIQFTGQLSQWYQDRADGSRKSLAIASETTYYSSVIGILGAAFGSVDIAKGAAGIAGGTALISSRYQLNVQASNFQRASDAFLCMRDHLADAQATLAYIQKFEDAKMKTKAVGPAVRFSELSRHVRKEVLIVQRKLDRAQRDIVIVEPDTDKLKAALMVKPLVVSGNQNTTAINELLVNLSTCSAAF